MNPITLEYNQDSLLANSILEVVRQSGEFVIHEDSYYDPEFVKEVLASDKSEGKRIPLEDLWS